MVCDIEHTLAHTNTHVHVHMSEMIYSFLGSHLTSHMHWHQSDKDTIRTEIFPKSTEVSLLNGIWRVPKYNSSLQKKMSKHSIRKSYRKYSVRKRILVVATHFCFVQNHKLLHIELVTNMCYSTDYKPYKWLITYIILIQDYKLLCKKKMWLHKANKMQF
jgi:hypothetical protein